MENNKKMFKDISIIMIFTIIITAIMGCEKLNNKAVIKGEKISITSHTEDTIYEKVEFKNERVISFKFSYNNGQDMIIEIRPMGASRLPNIGSYYLSSESEESQKALFMEMFSDCLMPYKVYAHKNSTNSRNEFNQIWTGGWHGADGDNFKLPSSAKNIKFELYVDGKKIEKNIEEDIKCNEAVIIIENLIDAYNTVDLQNGYDGNSRAVIKETQVLTLTSGKIRVNTEIEALEDVTIKTMYGIAMNVKVNEDNTVVNYIGSKDQEEKPLVVGGGEIYLHNSGTKSKDNSCYKVRVTDKESGDILEMFLDKDNGLGNFEYIGKDIPMVFSTNYKKIYYNLVNGKNLNLSKGEKVTFSGGWNIYNKNYKVIE